VTGQLLIPRRVWGWIRQSAGHTVRLLVGLLIAGVVGVGAFVVVRSIRSPGPPGLPQKVGPALDPQNLTVQSPAALPPMRAVSGRETHAAHEHGALKAAGPNRVAPSDPNGSPVALPVPHLSLPPPPKTNTTPRDVPLPPGTTTGR
jgi:hypothetical protein